MHSTRTISDSDVTHLYTGLMDFYSVSCPLPLCPPQKQIPPALRGSIGTVGPDRIASTPPKSHGRAVHCRGRPLRFPHRRRDLRSLRGESVQAAFRGVGVCQGVGKSILPGKARGFRGVRTPSNAMPAPMSSWRRSTNGSRKHNLQRLRNDRRIPPLGVKAVPSYACATDKVGTPHHLSRGGDPFRMGSLSPQ